MDTTTRSALVPARVTRARWPSWSAPMVGTSATVSPALRQAARCALRSWTVRTVVMALVMLPLRAAATIAANPLVRHSGESRNPVLLGKTRVALDTGLRRYDEDQPASNPQWQRV